MNSVEAMQIVFCSLKRSGALCKSEGTSIIVATWKTTVWRIFVDTSCAGNKKPVINEEIEGLQNTANENKKQAVIARIYPDGHIEYCNAENGKIIRPRCLVKGKRTKIFKMELYEQN